ncbi:CD44 isoform 23, partial [Pongo abelii]
DLPNAFDGPITITIVNRDGTRYVQKGEYRTNPEDIYPSNPTDDDVSSGSSSERSSTSGGYIFYTFSTVHPIPDEDGPWITDSTDRTPATTLMSTSATATETATKRQETQDWFSWLFLPSESKNHLHTTTQMAGTSSNTISAGWEPNEENEDERDRQLSFSGSGIDDDEDFISSTNMDSSHSTTLQPTANPNTGLVEDLDRTGPLSMTTQQSNSQSFSTSHEGLEEDKDHPTTSTLTSSSKDY